ncbi:PKD domain-containing protein [Mangrovivirga cuniculi]|uniref:Carbohydrate-binding protein n=1 Tax=Mangrovivirga cuniculi TaxID=2715131 RepID=A0A4D7JFR0_9BACT|nr:PKD domain-containing protein [Mangrovivirga cuniculi]QCK14471.1 carbohydrate-binding protein [Mangrovivirga cuniculi]
MKKLLNIFFVATLLILGGCEEEEYSLGTPPTEQDAQFTAEQDAQGENWINFSSSSDAFLKVWDFGNGSSAEGDQVTAYYPFAGEYEVTLTVYEKGGSVSSSQMITIANTDPEICNVEVLSLLTGGCDMPEGKTWVIDASRGGHFGVGPTTSYVPEWYAAGPNEKEGGGMYDDEYTFVLNESVFIQETNGDIYLNAGQASNFPGAYENPDVGDFTAPYTAPENINYSIFEGPEGYTNISFNNGGFIGYATGVNSYQIVSISENELFLRFKDATNPDLRWYHRLIPAGVTPISSVFNYSANGLEVAFTNESQNATGYTWDFGDGNTSTETNPVHTYAAEGTYTVTLTATDGTDEAVSTQEIVVSITPVALPLSFETFEPVFTTFGNSTYQYVDNPDQSGINTSARVLETVHGNEPWAGLFVDLDEPIDFSQSTEISLKVWAPATGTFRFKLEDIANSDDFIEIDQEVPVANEWVELTFDVSAAVGKSYARIVIFPGWNVADAGTFYVDDIKQKTTLPLTFEGAEPNWVTFGGSTYQYVDNPDASGINTSARVLETTHGNETWAGLFVDLSDPIDLTASTTMTVKVWAPTTGTFRFKLENIANSDDFIEVDASVDTANQWVELTFDVSGAPAGPYARIVIFPGWGVADAGTFYVDDIAQQ